MKAWENNTEVKAFDTRTLLKRNALLLAKRILPHEKKEESPAQINSFKELPNFERNLESSRV